ncbi:MAG TPA: hypothetical protein VMT17_06035 [Anaeromyxobacteraceae bacterium]|nr:hypothetical protein [Anaeromyxobacteraceae bacterium]
MGSDYVSVVNARQRIFSPLERLSDIVFGLIMALTMVGSLSVAGAARGDIHAILRGAIGCNVAWGIVDATMFLMAELVDAMANPRAGLTRDDVVGAAAASLLVSLSTVPVALPFLLPLRPWLAPRVSNAVALILLFAVGFRLGRYMGYRPFATGTAAIGIGTALVGLTMALGG